MVVVLVVVGAVCVCVCVCRTHTIDPKLIEGRTTALLAKVQAHISQGGSGLAAPTPTIVSASAEHRPVPADGIDLTLDEIVSSIPDEAMDAEARKKLRAKLEEDSLAKRQRSA